MNEKMLLALTFSFTLFAPGCGSEPSSPPVTQALVSDPANDTGDATDGDSAPAAESHAFTNRLASESSPYLLLHAHNPVDWYPWGPEALEKAKTENKPIFLSIGYSSCHWCHVMERESFLDEEIADFLNEHFVCIKVDREERPDIDTIYMTALNVFNTINRTGRGGGWPLTMFLTPDAEPFFGGTYFPARDGDRGASVGFLTIVKYLQQTWEESPERILTDAQTLSKFTKAELEELPEVEPAELGSALLVAVQDGLAEQYDPAYGGFGYDENNPQRPKFPEPSNLFFLLDRSRTAGDKEALTMLVGTLDRMAMGGIRDHLGGGFHRYSVDRFWRIPHFEKMLYDNGQLASVYAEAYAVTGREDYRLVVDELLAFVRRELTDDKGGFYSALDAESEGEEGKYHCWTRMQVEQALAPAEFELFAGVYGLNDAPNFEGMLYALQMSQALPDLAAEHESTVEEMDARLGALREKLLALREQRPRPLTDTKILTSWNGLMIRGFADAGRILENDEYLLTAARAADFVLTELRQEDGRLYRTYGGGAAKLNAYLDDYSFLANGLIALHQATGEEKWVAAARELTDKQIELFWDDEHAGFYFTSDDHESLLARSKSFVDGALPAGNSVAVENLRYLAATLDSESYQDYASRTLSAAARMIRLNPTAAPRLTIMAADMD